MTLEKRLALFTEELDTITTDRIKRLAIKVIEGLPDYFFEVSASSTGKYHPNYAKGKGGLVRHTKAAMLFCNYLLDMEQNQQEFNVLEGDLMRVALLVHDGFKYGVEKSDYTVFDHPLISAKWMLTNPDFREFINKEEADFLYLVISSHMGQWNTNKYSSVTLPKPRNKYQKFVHLCDYLASRSKLEVSFTKTESTSKPAPLEVTEANKETILDYELDFGKYAGSKVRDLLETQSGVNYISWCYENATAMDPNKRAILGAALQFVGKI